MTFEVIKLVSLCLSVFSLGISLGSLFSRRK